MSVGDVLLQIIPYASLLGEPAAPDTVLPAVSQLVAELTNPPDPRRIQGPRNFFFQAEDGIRCLTVTGVQTCALPISLRGPRMTCRRWPSCALVPLVVAGIV